MSETSVSYGTMHVPDEPVTSFRDFKWACGHTGPAVCKQCATEWRKERDRLRAENERLDGKVKTLRFTIESVRRALREGFPQTALYILDGRPAIDDETAGASKSQQKRLAVQRGEGLPTGGNDRG